MTDPVPVSDPLWYKDAVIYELHVKTFHESDGDGIGDFRGLIESADYRKEWGRTATWVRPAARSSSSAAWRRSRSIVPPLSRGIERRFRRPIPSTPSARPTTWWVSVLA